MLSVARKARLTWPLCGFLMSLGVAVGLQFYPPQPAAYAASPPVTKRAGSTYRVHRGDTLWGIAQARHTTVAALATRNHLDHPNLIYPGQVLVVPPPAPPRGQASLGAMAHPPPARRSPGRPARPRAPSRPRG